MNESRLGIEKYADTSPLKNEAKKLLQELLAINEPGSVSDETLESMIFHQLKSNATFSNRRNPEIIAQALFDSFRQAHPNPEQN
jgi:hypothetical protein